MLDLDRLTGVEFESLCERLFLSMGFTVETTKATRDGGIDLIVNNPTPITGGKYIVQCKRYAGTVGEPIIRDLYGVMMAENVNKAILLTTGRFTDSAISFADGKPIELIDRDALVILLKKQGIEIEKTEESLYELIEYYRKLGINYDVEHNNMKKAAECFEKAIEYGGIYEYYLYGHLYESTDIEFAKRVYKKGLDNGCSLCAIALARLESNNSYPYEYYNTYFAMHDKFFVTIDVCRELYYFVEFASIFYKDLLVNDTIKGHLRIAKKQLLNFINNGISLIDVKIKTEAQEHIYHKYTDIKEWIENNITDIDDFEELCIQIYDFEQIVGNVCLFGEVISGVISKNDIIIVKSFYGECEAKVLCIEKDRNLLECASRGDNIGILIEETNISEFDCIKGYAYARKK